MLRRLRPVHDRVGHSRVADQRLLLRFRQEVLAFLRREALGADDREGNVMAYARRVPEAQQIEC